LKVWFFFVDLLRLFYPIVFSDSFSALVASASVLFSLSFLLLRTYCALRRVPCVIGEEVDLARWLGRCREPEGRPETPQPARQVNFLSDHAPALAAKRNTSAATGKKA
jgi:hypothetical protein